MRADRIVIDYPDGMRGIFTPLPDGRWDQVIQTRGNEALRVTGYDPSEVLQVLANAVEAKETAE